jgi:transmembrane sensor
MKPVPKDRFRISEEAALWLVRLEGEDSPELRAQFTEWARQSPFHVEEFLFAQATSRHLAGVDAERRIDLEAMGEGSEVGSVVPLLRNEDSRSGRPSPASRQTLNTAGRSRRRFGLVTALAASIAVAVGAWMVLAPAPPAYSTAAGDQQAIKLPDGSVMYLNTASRVEVRFTHGQRELRLLAGEALFVVERDPARPFRVISDGVTVQALGTEFNVYRRAGGTRVSVIEGAVSVSSGASPDTAPLKLAAGDQADVTQGQVRKAVKPDVQQAIAWRARRLMFQADPLEEVAREFNRYGHRQSIRLEGDEIHHRTISGVFDADDPQPLIQFLEEDPALSVTRTQSEIVVRVR